MEMSQSTPCILGTLRGRSRSARNTTLEIWSDKSATIGTGPTCDLVVSHPNVSAVHCRIYTKKAEDDWLIYCEDLSKNGIHFNGWKIKKHASVMLLDKCLLHISEHMSYEFDQIHFSTPKASGTYPEALHFKYKLTEKLLGHGPQSETVLLCLQDPDPNPEKPNKLDKDQFVCKFVRVENLDRETADKIRIQWDIMRTIDHPCVLKTIEIEAQPIAYVVSPLYRGGTLEEFVLQRPKIPELEIMFIFYQIAQATNYLHGQNIVHRDLKPQNILLVTDREFPRIVLAGFGQAARADETVALCDSIGTPAYCAPELVETQLYDDKADQWSLGAILYFLITRQHAFTNDSRSGNAVRDRVINGIYDTNNTNWMEISDTAKQLVAKLLTVNAQQRLSASECLKSEWFLQRLPFLESLFLSSQSELP